jgi:hypothetical protein
MSSDLGKSGEGTKTVGQKLDTLSASVDKRFDTLSASVDKRFDTLSGSVDERFDTLSASVDERFDAVDVALIGQRQYTEFAFDRLADEMRNGFNGVDGRFNRLERKLDQFIDTQSRANALVERRLTALEPRSGQE